MHNHIEGCRTDFILIAEDAIGMKILCEEYGTERAARTAFELIDAPTVCLIKQTCSTEIIAHKEKAP